MYDWGVGSILSDTSHMNKSYLPDRDSSTRDKSPSAANDALGSSLWLCLQIERYDVVNYCNMLEKDSDGDQPLMRLSLCEAYASEPPAALHAERLLRAMRRALDEEGAYSLAEECCASDPQPAPTDVAVALAMAFHARLGQRSPLRCLDQGLLACIAAYATAPVPDTIYTTGLLSYVITNKRGVVKRAFTEAEVRRANELVPWRRAQTWAARVHEVPLLRRGAPPPRPVIALVDNWPCDVSGWADGRGDGVLRTNEEFVYSGPAEINMAPDSTWPVYNGGRRPRPQAPALGQRLRGRREERDLWVRDCEAHGLPAEVLGRLVELDGRRLRIHGCGHNADTGHGFVLCRSSEGEEVVFPAERLRATLRRLAATVPAGGVASGAGGGSGGREERDLWVRDCEAHGLPAEVFGTVVELDGRRLRIHGCGRNADTGHGFVLCRTSEGEEVVVPAERLRATLRRLAAADASPGASAAAAVPAGGVASGAGGGSGAGWVPSCRKGGSAYIRRR
jgi:hypothetical protein